MTEAGKDEDFVRRQESTESPEEPAFKGSFTFVNHDASNLSALPHRHKVFSHVQSSYNKWKRQEVTHKYRKSNKKHATGACKPNFDSGTAQNQRRKSSPFRDIDSHSGAIVQIPTPTSNSSRSFSPFDRLSPLSLLQDGNSDPFNAYAIKIDSTVSQVMKFTRDIYVPSINRDETNPGQLALSSDWTETVDSLHDEGTAYARLARVASVMSQDSGAGISGAPLEALLFKKKAMEILRSRLVDSSSWSDSRTFDSIKSLQSAELQSGNFPGALFHTSVLAHLLQNGIIDVDIKSIFGVFYHDFQRASLTFTRPYFDLQTWYPGRFNPTWQAFEKCLPAAPVLRSIVPLDLDPTIEGEPLRAAFTTIRHCLAVLMLARKDPSLGQSATSFYLRSRTIYIMACLIDHYLDVCALMNEPGITYDAFIRIRTRAYLSLAALYWNRCAAGCDAFQIGTTTIFRANDGIIDRLRQALIDSEINATDNISEKYARARLWALYIGAAAENAKAPTPTKDGHQKLEWFSRKLGQQARRLGLLTWPSVRQVLQGFLYSDGVLAHGSSWFWKTQTPEPLDVE